MLKKIIQQLLNLFYPLFKKFMPFQVYAYLAVGGANTLFNIGLFTVCYLWLSASPVYIASFNISLLAVEIATIISFIASVFTGFWLSKNFAFTDAVNEKKETTKQFGKYSFVALQGQFSDYLITKGLIVAFGINATIAYVASTVIMLVINFFLQKYYTFRVKNKKAV
jgi:putative flippase GtrA